MLTDRACDLRSSACCIDRVQESRAVETPCRAHEICPVMRTLKPSRTLRTVAISVQVERPNREREVPLRLVSSQRPSLGRRGCRRLTT